MEKLEPLGNYTYISLNFVERVKVTTHSLVQNDFSTIMSLIGANMGLWLGVGGLQILQSFLNYLNEKCSAQIEAKDH